MAEIPIVASKLFHGSHKWLWEGLSATNATGGPITPNQGSVAFSDKTVHVKGDFGTNIAVAIQGSNDGATWITLTDPGGTALSFTAEGVETILQNPAFIRPAVTAGSDGDVDVSIVGRGNIQLR